MGISKILRKQGVVVAGTEYDVLIPLPANDDACLKRIGINDFDDTDDEWDANFCEILECLTDGEQFHVTGFNPNTGEIEPMETVTLSDIQGYLALYDHLNYVIHLNERRITFTRGHEIFWLEGSFVNRINLLRFPIYISDNDRIAELF
jgi:hypothetical protein